jgi:hypothetical protein
MGRRLIVAALMSLMLSAILDAPCLAATPTAPTQATADLIAGPPAGPWTVYDQGTGPRTALEIWGSKASMVKGFTDAYQRTWEQPGQGLVDRVEHFTSTLWAAFRLGESRGSAKQNTSHSSFSDISGFGPSAYEVTDQADAQGFIKDTIVFTHGDYVAVVAIGATGSPSHETLLDQARRQFDILPIPTAEYEAIGNGILVGSAVFFGVVIALVVVVVIVVVIIVSRSRRRPAPYFAAQAGPRLSPDGRYWWDGQTWRDAGVQAPPGAQLSPDHAFWWDGASWRPVPPGGGGTRP